ncbi:MAG: hypothetical protein ACLPLZ_14040 [Terracidiphilus sp.]
MNTHDDDRIKQLLQQSLPPVDPDSEPARDLWPAVLRRLDEPEAPLRAAAGPVPRAVPWPRTVPWFDWALLAGLVLFAVSFPATIPVFLYYL